MSARRTGAGCLRTALFLGVVGFGLAAIFLLSALASGLTWRVVQQQRAAALELPKAPMVVQQPDNHQDRETDGSR